MPTGLSLFLVYYSEGWTFNKTGSNTSRPSMAVFRLMPVTECGVMRYAARVLASGPAKTRDARQLRSLASAGWSYSSALSGHQTDGETTWYVFCCTCDEEKLRYKLTFEIASLIAVQLARQPKSAKEALYSARIHVDAYASHKGMASRHDVVNGDHLCRVER